MQNVNYDMFTTKGNYMVHRIVEAGRNLRMCDTDQQVWEWAEHELRKLAHSPGYEEAIDTAVRERVYDKLGVDIY